MYLIVYAKHQFIKHDVYEAHFLLMEIVFMVKLIPIILISYVVLVIAISMKTFQDQFMFDEEQPTHNLQTYWLQIQTLPF